MDKIIKTHITKAVSPLVAAVLLIAFTMTVGAILTAWITNFTGAQQEKVEEGQRKIECSYAGIDVRNEFSRLNTSYDPYGSVVIEGYVVNNGLGPISITQVQVYDRSGKGSRIYNLVEPISLEKDESKYVDINITLPYKELKITTDSDLDKVRLYSECEGVTALITKPYGGWVSFDTPVSSISQLVLG